MKGSRLRGRAGRPEGAVRLRSRAVDRRALSKGLLSLACGGQGFGKVEILWSLGKGRRHCGARGGLDLRPDDLDVEVRHPGLAFAIQENPEGDRLRFIWSVEHRSGPRLGAGVGSVGSASSFV